MRKPETSKPGASKSATPWSVPLAAGDVPGEARRYDLVAGPEERAAVARVLGLADLPRLEAQFDLVRSAAGAVRVSGTVSASVTQTCVVTLDPVTSEIAEAVDVVFAPARPDVEATADLDVPFDTEDPPEPLPPDGTVDLGAIAVEFLELGIDSYPRRPDAVFETPNAPDEGPTGPFAGLAALKGREGSGR